MKNSLLIFALASVLALGTCGCSESLGPTEASAPPGIIPAILAESCGEPVVVALVTRQHIDVGTVTVTNDEEFLYVEIVTTDSWVLLNSSVDVATSPEELPQPGSYNSKLGPSGVFATAHDHLTEYTYEIPLEESWYETNQELCVMVHILVEDSGSWGFISPRQQAWAEGEPLPGNSGAMYFMYTVQSCYPGCGCTITVTFPNGGEYICAYNWIEVTWDSEGEECGADVSIELLHDGEPCLTVTSSTPNTGTYHWEEPEQCGTEMEGYTILITDLESGASDESDGTFIIDICPEM